MQSYCAPRWLTRPTDATETDPALLEKHSQLRTFAVPATGFTYPSIRTFYRPHPRQNKLPSEPRPIPLLVFIHGLGGSLAQFNPILSSLVNLAPCLGIDLPGCGVSAFDPTAWEAYTPASLAHLLAAVIDAYRLGEDGQGVVLVGHSMGASLAALLASSTAPCASTLSRHVLGLVGICPSAGSLDKKRVRHLKHLPYIPDLLFSLLRKWDRRGGFNSASVTRITGPDAEKQTRRLQLQFNQQSRTAVWKRMVWGAIPSSGDLGRRGMPGKEIWSGLDLPVFLVAGEDDAISPPSEVRKILSFLRKDDSGVPLSESELPIALSRLDDLTTEAGPVERTHSASISGDSHLWRTNRTAAQDSCKPRDSANIPKPRATDSASNSSHDRLVVKTSILPKPASHAMLYASSSARTLSGLIGAFISTHVDHRLSLGWQLQYLSTEGKWDVKNLAKWKAVQPVSQPIAGVFCAMKTLREVDELHRPEVFVDQWKGTIQAVVDISHENPVYDPVGLEAGGIAYHKFPTISKIPPTPDEVQAFFTLIDKLRHKPVIPHADFSAAQSQSDSESLPSATRCAPFASQSKLLALPEASRSQLIGVHCHYGFNRTGFFVICYLVERLGYKLDDAIVAFVQARPPGIRHEHFIDTLHVRYTVGLKRFSTLSTV